jgi:hypothetical protein
LFHIVGGKREPVFADESRQIAPPRDVHDPHLEPRIRGLVAQRGSKHCDGLLEGFRLKRRTGTKPHGNRFVSLTDIKRRAA